MNIEVFHFGNQEYLKFLLLIPVFIILFVVSILLRRKALQRYGEHRLLTVLMPEKASWRLVMKFILGQLALASLIIALARPQFGSKLENVKRKGSEIVIALDVSNSMLAQDITPSRLDKSRMAILQMIDKLDNDRIGIIVFAGGAYTQLPITSDISAVKMFLNTVSTNFVPKQGTAIGSALELASRSFTPESATGKAIILISDGENHEDDAIEGAKHAAEKGIVVHTIGMGTIEGAPIPIRGTRDFHRDKDGSVVISRLDEDNMTKIAMAGQGVYVRASNSNAGLSTLYSEINKLKKEEVESKMFTEYDEKYQWFIAAALFFLIVDLLIISRKNRLLRNVRLFEIQ